MVLLLILKSQTLDLYISQRMKSFITACIRISTKEEEEEEDGVGRGWPFHCA